MLVFKKNIYYQPLPSLDRSPYGEDDTVRPHAFNLISKVLDGDQLIFGEMDSLSESEAVDRLKILYPHVARFATPAQLRKISNNLHFALRNTDHWFGMNCYHLCYLYDSLLEEMEEYNYADQERRLELMPELRGQEFDFNQFLNEYFFNTVFLMAAERFNNLPPDKRRKLGKLDHAYFGALLPDDNPVDQEDPTLSRVINAQPPIPEEIELTPYTENPYLESTFPEN